MNRTTYRPRVPTAAEKDAAMDFYRPDDLGDPQVRKFLDERQPERVYKPGTISGAIEDAVNKVEHDHDMRGQLSERAKVRQFISAGNATLTLVSKETGDRLTFKFGRPKDWEPSPQRPVAPIFVSVLSGSDNESDYSFMGTVWPENNMFPDGPLTYRHSPKSRLTFGSKSVKVAVWFVTKALADDDKFQQTEVWHEGRCGRCGRKLTVPSSIESGFGPECIGKVGA